MIQNHVICKFFYVRECFQELWENIFKEADLGPTCICGNPGIGKSAFALYVFCKIIQDAESRTDGASKSAVWYSQGGGALYFNANTSKVTYHEYGVESSIWRDPNCWLLLVGRAYEKPFSDKKEFGIVFASPKKKNYHEFIKDDGGILYMPPWEWEEIESMIMKLCSDKAYLVHVNAICKSLNLPGVEEPEASSSKTSKTGQESDDKIDLEMCKNGILTEFKLRFRLSVVGFDCFYMLDIQRKR